MGNDNRFNALDIVENLQEAGVPEKQAKIFARYFSLGLDYSVATKQDLETTKLELHQAIELVRRDVKELDVKIENVRAELKKDIELVRAELKQDMKEMDTGLKLEMAKMRENMKGMETRIIESQNSQTFKTITTMTGVVTLLLLMIRFLPEILK